MEINMDLRGPKAERARELAMELFTLMCQFGSDTEALDVSVTGVVNEVVDDPEMTALVLMMQALLARCALMAGVVALEYEDRPECLRKDRAGLEEELAAATAVGLRSLLEK